MIAELMSAPLGACPRIAIVARASPFGRSRSVYSWTGS